MHRHWCEYVGHYWECSGTAVRLFQAEPSECMCFDHGVPMEQGDHSECRLELLSCPEHRNDQMRAMGYEPDHVFEQQSDEESSMFRDENGNPICGWCFWCGCSFFSFEEHEAHVANGMAACSVFQELKDEHTTPPILEAMFEEAGLIEHDNGENRE